MTTLKEATEKMMDRDGRWRMETWKSYEWIELSERSLDSEFIDNNDEEVVFLSSMILANNWVPYVKPRNYLTQMEAYHKMFTGTQMRHEVYDGLFFRRENELCYRPDGWQLAEYDSDLQKYPEVTKPLWYLPED